MAPPPVITASGETLQDAWTSALSVDPAGSVFLAGGLGDTLQGPTSGIPAATQVWTIDAADAGSLNGAAFSSFENLAGDFSRVRGIDKPYGLYPFHCRMLSSGCSAS